MLLDFPWNSAYAQFPHLTFSYLMHHFRRIIFPIATLAIFSGTLSAADTLELKQRWVVGKKYDQTIRTVETSSVSVGAQTMEESTSTTMEISQAVRAQGDGNGKRMTLKYERVAMEKSMNGEKASFDSSKPDPGNDPQGMAKIMGSAVGKELQILLTDKDDIIGIENYDDFIRQLGTSPVPGVNMASIFGKESIVQMMKGQELQSVPSHPVKPGDSWPFTMNVDMAGSGKVSIVGNYMLKGMADHDGNRVAEIFADARISMDFTGAQLAQFGMKVEGGSLKGTILFDPKLGIARLTQMTQTMTMTMRNPQNPSATLAIPVKRTVEMTLTKVQDLK